MGYKIVFIESISFNYNVIAKTLLMISLLFPISLLGVQMQCFSVANAPRAGAQGEDGAIGTGHAELTPVTLSDFQTSEKGKTNPLSTAILSKLFFWNFFGGDSENKNPSSFDKTSYQFLSPVPEGKRAGVFIVLLYNLKSLWFARDLWFVREIQVQLQNMWSILQRIFMSLRVS